MKSNTEVYSDLLDRTKVTYIKEDVVLDSSKKLHDGPKIIVNIVYSTGKKEQKSVRKEIKTPIYVSYNEDKERKKDVYRRINKMLGET